jgi:hypothetical protein
MAGFVDLAGYGRVWRGVAGPTYTAVHSGDSTILHTIRVGPGKSVPDFLFQKKLGVL